MGELLVYKKTYTAVPANHIYPFIPGTIIDIFIKTGDHVRRGDKLLTLNAMKMNNEITAPFNGIVKAIHIKSGDKVSKNDVILEIEA